MDGHLKRAISYIKNPAHKTKVKLGTAATTVAFDSLLMYAMNADKNNDFFTPYVACKAGSAALFLSTIVPKLTEMVAKAPSDFQAHLRYQAANLTYCLFEYGLYNAAGAPDPRQSVVTFAMISGIGGAALTHITRHPDLGYQFRTSGKYALEALFWIGRTFYTGGKAVYKGGKKVTHVVGDAARTVVGRPSQKSLDNIFDDTGTYYQSYPIDDCD